MNAIHIEHSKQKENTESERVCVYPHTYILDTQLSYIEYVWIESVYTCREEIQHLGNYVFSKNLIRNTDLLRKMNSFQCENIRHEDSRTLFHAFKLMMEVFEAAKS